MNNNLVVDKAYFFVGSSSVLILEIDGKFYRASTRVGGVDPKSLKEIPSIAGMNLRELKNHDYVMQKLMPKNGFDVKLGRPISESEFEDLKKEYNLTEDDISEPFADKKGGIYGEKYEKKFTSIQVRVDDTKAISLETKLRKKGIEACNGTSGRVDIRIAD